MNRYLLFSGCSFYANGGWIDWKGSYASLEEATAVAARIITEEDEDFSVGVDDWWHVVDVETGKVVAGKQGVYSGFYDDPLEPGS
jgi:hypothetical protein